jgi:hypothetical protein
VMATTFPETLNSASAFFDILSLPEPGG